MIKKFLLTTSVTVLSAVCLVSPISARTLAGQSDWSVRTISADMPYCTVARQYEAGALLTFARNIKGEGTIALDFNRDAFNPARPYPVKIQVGDLVRQYMIKPAGKNVLIIRTGSDSDLMHALEDYPQMQVMIDDENFAMDLSGYSRAALDFQECVNGAAVTAMGKPSSPSGMPAVSPSNLQTVQDKSQDQNLEIDALVQDNQRLKARLAETEQSTQSTTTADTASERQLTQKLVLAEQKNAELTDKINQLEGQLTQTRQSVNPDLNAVIREKQAQIQTLTEQNQALKTALADAGATKSAQDMSEQDSHAMRAQLADLQTQIQTYKAERDQYRTQLQSAEPKVIIKEVEKKVPVIPADMSASDAEIANRLAEAETQAEIYKAERDEYQRLLQSERQRVRDAGGIEAIAAANSGATPGNSNMIGEIEKLQAEKADLQRRLAYVESKAEQMPKVAAAPTPAPVEPTPDKDNSADIARLTEQLTVIEANFSQVKQEKADMQNRLMQAEARVTEAEQKLASAKTVEELANVQPAATDTHMKSLRAEIAALEAQNKMLRADVAEKPRSGGAAASQNSLKEAASDPMAVKSPLPMRPTVTPAVAVLSGQDIRKMVEAAKIPLAKPIDRISRVSGPDFAAFTWDTGVVYGSGEQSRMGNPAAFDQSVAQYIDKTRSRCIGSFDQHVSDRIVNGQTVRVADIACVDANGNGAAASILFFVKDNMFYALAHEADMNSFKVAMDMRDRLLAAVSSVF